MLEKNQEKASDFKWRFFLRWIFYIHLNEERRKKKVSAMDIKRANERNWTYNSCIINVHQKLLHTPDDCRQRFWCMIMWLSSPSIRQQISTLLSKES